MACLENEYKKTDLIFNFLVLKFTLSFKTQSFTCCVIEAETWSYTVKEKRKLRFSKTKRSVEYW